MNFELDLEKSIQNKVRHGIDFFEAQALWGYPVIMVRVKHPTELRSAFIGMIGEKYYAALVGHEEDGYLSPISVRPAREEEIELYEENAF